MTGAETVITKLTPQQEARIPEVREYWRSIGLSTKETNVALARKAISDLYAVSGADRPEVIFVLESPMACALAIAMFRIDKSLSGQLNYELSAQLNDQLGAHQLSGQLGDQLVGQLSAQLRAQLGDQLRGQLRNQLNDRLSPLFNEQLNEQLVNQLDDQLRGQLNDQLSAHLNNQLIAQLFGHLGSQIIGQLSAQLRDQLGGVWQVFYWWNMLGSVDAWWASYYEFCGELVEYKTEDKKRLAAYQKVIKTVFWTIPYPKIAFVSMRPNLISFDDQDRLHNETGPAIRFRDGYSLYAIHGVRLPFAHIVEAPEKITLAEIREEINAEVRRVMITRMGLDKYFQQSEAKLIDESADPGQLDGAWHSGLDFEAQCAYLKGHPDKALRLYELSEDAFGGKVRMLHVRNGTPEGGENKWYWINAPQDTDDVLDAVVATYPGITKKQYLKMVRT